MSQEEVSQEVVKVGKWARNAIALPKSSTSDAHAGSKHSNGRQAVEVHLSHPICAMPLDNRAIIERVRAWQGSWFLHPLTCRKDSTHARLEAQEHQEEVVLVCPTCGSQQEVPDVVLTADLSDPFLRIPG